MVRDHRPVGPALAGPQFGLDTVVDDSAVTVHLSGELDVTSAPLLIAAVESHLARGRHAVRLDLSRTTFCDCAGLGAIVHVGNRVRECGEACALGGASPRVERLFRLARLTGSADPAHELPPRNPEV